MMNKSGILRLIDADAQKHIEFLQSLIRAPSPNPPGDTRDALKVVDCFLEQCGISRETISPKEDAPNIVSTFWGTFDGSSHPSNRSIVLNGHIDQFPVGDANKWQRDPYSGDVEDGFVHGRSGVDMKAGTAASILAFSYLHQYRPQLSGRCTLEVVSDEETGGGFGTRYLLEDDKRADQWKADCVLIGEPGGLQSIRFGEKGTLRMTITVTALGGHGAYIHLSEGAIRTASRLIQRLLELEQHPGQGMDEPLRRYMQQQDVRKVADEIMSDGASDAMLIPTVNIGTIKGGDKINMIPSECVFEVEVRIPIGVKSEAIRARIERVLEEFPSASYEIHKNHSYPSTHSPPDNVVVGMLQSNAEMLGLGRPKPICSLGATDCKHFRRHNVPAYAYGPSPKGMAERDEKVSIEEFLYLVKVHTLTVWDYLGGAA